MRLAGKHAPKRRNQGANLRARQQLVTAGYLLDPERSPRGIVLLVQPADQCTGCVPSAKLAYWLSLRVVSGSRAAAKRPPTAISRSAASAAIRPVVGDAQRDVQRC